MNDIAAKELKALWDCEPLMPKGLETWTEEGLSAEEVEQHYATVAEFIRQQISLGETEIEIREKYGCTKPYYDYLERTCCLDPAVGHAETDGRHYVHSGYRRVTMLLAPD